ncbi:hypothetical protein EGU77_13260 [Pseudomonas syringae pv. theae]|nr:hypothetical protein [Pseudomonas syringae pv. theae]
MILPEGRGSELARELPGTGSKTSRLGSQGPAEVISFRAASRPIADKRGVARSAHAAPIFRVCQEWRITLSARAPERQSAGTRVSVTLAPASIFKTAPSPHRQSAWQNAR